MEGLVECGWLPNLYAEFRLEPWKGTARGRLWQR